MEHPFFACVDWDKIYNKEITPPFVPKLTSETDTSCFDQEFTREPVQLTPPNANSGNLETVHEIDDEIQGNFTQFVFHDVYSSSLANNSQEDIDKEEVEKMIIDE